MGLKTKVGFAMLSSAAGAAMLVGGTFALFTDYHYTNSNNFTAGTVKISTTDGMSRVQVGTEDLGNMAPGDTVKESFTITNSGSLDEWVSLESSVNAVSPHPNIWDNLNLGGNDSSGNAQSLDHSAGTNGSYHGLSDQNASGQGGLDGVALTGDFQTDNHPATYGYTVVVSDHSKTYTAVDTTKSEISTNDWSYNHPFLLPVGDSATVTYSVTLPLAAHNDYQSAAGSLTVEADAVQARNNWKVTGSADRQDGNVDFTAANTDHTAIPYSWQPDVNN